MIYLQRHRLGKQWAVPHEKSFEFHLTIVSIFFCGWFSAVRLTRKDK